MIRLDELINTMIPKLRESVIISTIDGTMDAYDDHLDRYDVMSMEAFDLSDKERVLWIRARER